MRVERLDDPAPAPDEVVVAPDACGICGTDIHIIDGEFLGTRFPIVYNDELTIIGSMAILHSFERARDVVAAGIIDGDALITHPESRSATTATRSRRSAGATGSRSRSPPRADGPRIRECLRSDSRARRSAVAGTP